MVEQPIFEVDKAGRRKPPRHCRYLGIPRANIRGHYRLGLSLIRQLQAIANLLNIEPYASLEWVKKGGMRVTTSAVVRALLRLGLKKAHDHERGYLEAIWDEVRSEPDDELELDHGLDYTHKKFG